MFSFSWNKASRFWPPAGLLIAIISAPAAAPVEQPTSHPANVKWRNINVALPPKQVTTHIALTPASPLRTDHKKWNRPLSGDQREPLLARRDDFHFFIRTALRSIRHIEITPTGKFRILADWKTPHRVEHIAASTEVVLITGDRKLSVLNTKDGSTRYSQTLADPVVAIAVDRHYSSVLTSRGDLLVLSMTEALPTLRRFTHDHPLSSSIALDPGRIAYTDAQSIVIAEPDFATQSLRIMARAPLDTPAIALRWISDGLLIVNARGTTLMTYTAEGGLNWASHLDHRARAHSTPRITVGNTLVALTHDGHTTTLIDAALPQHQEILGFLPATTPGTQAFARSERFFVHITSTGGSIWDLSVQPALLTNEHLATGEGVNLGGQRRAHLDPIKKLLYVADWFSGLHVYDLTEPDQPHLLSSYHTPGSPKGVVVKDDIAYVADDDNGLRVIDVSDARRPREITALSTPGLAYTPVIDGEWLYLASHRGGFQIINITDPRQPRLVSDIHTGGKAWSIVVRNHIAYVACSEAGLLIYDVNDPAKPKLLGQYAPGGNAEEIILDGPRAYVAFFEDGVHVLDIAQPDQPRRLSVFAARGNARGLALQDSTLYVADWLAGIRTVDISDPLQPRLIADFDTPGAAWGIKISGSRAYVLDWWGGLLTLDVNIPRKTRLLDRFPDCEKCSDIDVTERYAYIATGQRGVQLFDIKNSLNPTWVTGFELAQPARYLARVGDALLVAGLSEISLIDTHDPFHPQRRATLESCAPIVWIRSGPGHIAIGCQDELRVIEIDPTRMTLTQKIDELGQYADVATVLGTWVAITREGAVTSIDPHPKTTFADEFRLPLRSGLRRAHSTGGKLVLVSEDHVTVLADDGLVLQKLADSDVALGEGSSLLADDTLLVSHARALNTYHVSPDGRLVHQAKYALADSMSGLAARNGYAYGASAGLITAVRLLPKWPIDVTTSNHATLTLPETLPAGRYGWVMFSTHGPATYRDNAIGIAAFELNKRVPPPLEPQGMEK